MATTARQMFEGLLIELSKVNAPSLLLSEYNYYINKAIKLYINKRYNVYDTSALTGDDLRVLKSTAILDVDKVKSYGNLADVSEYPIGDANLFGATYTTVLPDDYVHILNCICLYELAKPYSCYDKGNFVLFPAKRLTADAWSIVVTDYYNRPAPERPYFYIHNVNTSTEEPTDIFKYKDLENQTLDNLISGTTPEVDPKFPKEYFKYKENLEYTATGQRFDVYCNKLGHTYIYDTAAFIPSGWFECELTDDLSQIQSINEGRFSVIDDFPIKTKAPRTIKINNDTIDLVDKQAGLRVANPSKVRCEIRYGRDDSVFKLKKVFIDYIKAPLTIRLTQEQVDLTQDTSLILEFPDYVCQEIINELTLLVMERVVDPRTSSHYSVTQSIVDPAQQLTTPKSSTKTS